MNLNVPMESSVKTFWNPWPWGLVGFLSLFAAAVIGFGFFASHHHQELVRPDYYEHEIRFQEQIDQSDRARDLGKRVRVEASPDGRSLDLRLLAGSEGTVQLYRPADARLDREFPISVDQQGCQRLDLSELKPGLWFARVRWHAGGQEFFNTARVIVAVN